MAHAAALPPRHILAVKLSSFGDIIHATPCFRALRRAFPDARIAVAVEHRWADVVRHNPNVDEVLESSVQRGLGLAYLGEIHRTLSASRKAHGPFDLAIDFQGNRRSAAWIYLSRAKIKAGRGHPRPGWRSAFIPDMSRHAVLVCAGVCRHAGIPIDELDPEIRTNPADETSLDGILRAGRMAADFILLNPFSRWNSKSWPEERAQELAIRIERSSGFPVVVTGGAEDRERAERLVGQAGALGIMSLAGRLTLGQALCLFRRGILMISCDSGPMHAAAALGTPVLALFGPTHPESTGPWGRGHRVLQALRPDVHDKYRDDPEGRYMAALSVDSVFEAAKEMLGKRVAAP